MLRRVLVSLLVVSAGWIGCANNNDIDPCKRALQRLKDECDVPIEGIDMLSTNCSGPQSTCVADCLEFSPCEDIDNNSGEFAACTKECQ